MFKTLFWKSLVIIFVGDSLAILRAELKSQKKHVKNLKKKSLWSRILEEVRQHGFIYILCLDMRDINIIENLLYNMAILPDLESLLLVFFFSQFIFILSSF